MPPIKKARRICYCQQAGRHETGHRYVKSLEYRPPRR
jgi:hypothetical protein